MKSKMRKINGVARELEITISSEKVKDMLEGILVEIRKEALFPGFRKGNAPADLVRKKYYAEAVEEMKQKLIPDAYQEALGEHQLDPVSYPSLSDIVMNDDGSLGFKATFDVKPAFKLPKYKGMKLQTAKVEVTDEEVEKAVSSIRSLHSEFITVDRPVQKGDFSICDVETLVEGRPEGKKRENMWIEADKETSMLGLGEELCGLKSGDTKTIEAVLPETYPDKKYAGKKASFTVVVKEVREKKLPALDDELAKKAGKDSLEELREDFRSRILEGKGEESRAGLKRQVIEELVKKCDFDVPASMVSRQLDIFVQRAEEEMAQKGVPKESIESNRDKLRERLAASARDKVKAYFILDEIAVRENITASEEDADRWIKDLADYYGKKFEDVKKYYAERDLLGGLLEQLREDKTLEHIISEAEINVK